MRAGSQGLRVAPNASDSVTASASSSGTCVLPINTAPASRSRRTTSESRSAASPWASEPWAGDLSRHVGFVLDRDRDAVQRRRAIAAARVGGVGGGERLVGKDDPVGAQVRVEPRDPLQVELGELACGHVAGADQLGLAVDTGEGELGCVHGAGPYR